MSLARYVLWSGALAATLTGCVLQTANETRDDASFSGVEMPCMPPSCDLSGSDEVAGLDGGAASDQTASARTAAPAPAAGASSGTGDLTAGGGSPQTGGPGTGGDPAGGGWPGAGGSVAAGGAPPDEGGSPESADSGLAGQLGVDPHDLDALLTRLAAAVAARSGPETAPAQSGAPPTIMLARRAAKGDRLAKTDSGLLTSEDGANAGGGSGNGKAARIIPDGRDDDIIARRLRRAAELERDPSIKQKLWQEYLAYRQNAHAP